MHTEQDSQPDVHETVLRKRLGRRLRTVRGKLSQETYAKKLQVHVNTLARYERGERMPTTIFLQRVAAMGTDIHWLLTGARVVHDITNEKI